MSKEISTSDLIAALDSMSKSKSGRKQLWDCTNGMIREWSKPMKKKNNTEEDKKYEERKNNYIEKGVQGNE